MATTTARALYPKLLRLSSSYRHLSSTPSSISAVSPLNFDEKPDSTAIPPPAAAHNSILNFEDHKELFSSIPTAKLLRSSLTLHMAAVGPMVDAGLWVMNSRLMETAILRELVLGTVKRTFYEHFCAGADMEEVGRTVKTLHDAGLWAMLDYGLEHAVDNESCDRNTAEFIRTVEFAKSLPPSSVSYVIVKITAICPMTLLNRVSHLLRWEHRDPSSHLPWKLKTLPIFADSTPLYHTQIKPDPLTRQEELDLNLSLTRLHKICRKCLESDTPLLIDAEETSVQPAIDYFTYSSAVEFNGDDKPIVFGTIQAYLRDAKDRLILAKTAAEKMGIALGFKLVRGAYMSSEKQVADSLGVESPVHGSIQQTHRCYDDCASFMLERIAGGSGALVLATHNIESGKLAAAKARELGIGKEKERLQFAQLYGMAEALSFGLRNAGFQVSKYLPFGPVEQIMPYLLRRAEENRGLLSTTTLDRHLISKELKRRLMG